MHSLPPALPHTPRPSRQAQTRPTNVLSRPPARPPARLAGRRRSVTTPCCRRWTRCWPRGAPVCGSATCLSVHAHAHCACASLSAVCAGRPPWTCFRRGGRQRHREHSHGPCHAERQAGSELAAQCRPGPRRRDALAAASAPCRPARRAPSRCLTVSPTAGALCWIDCTMLAGGLSSGHKRRARRERKKGGPSRSTFYVLLCCVGLAVVLLCCAVSCCAVLCFSQVRGKWVANNRGCTDPDGRCYDPYVSSAFLSTPLFYFGYGLSCAPLPCPPGRLLTLAPKVGRADALLSSRRKLLCLGGVHPHTIFDRACLD